MADAKPSPAFLTGLEHVTKPAWDRLRPAPSWFGAPDPQPEHGQIHERNGIWVVTIDGVWRGDYIKCEHALEAVTSASSGSR
ncbi:MAG: hypothetical protein JJU08_02570 [Rhodobacteraceae bacterium]|nr:hypothetical protein [Paracoccaceae bacterium]